VRGVYDRNAAARTCVAEAMTNVLRIRFYDLRPSTAALLSAGARRRCSDIAPPRRCGALRGATDVSRRTSSSTLCSEGMLVASLAPWSAVAGARGTLPGPDRQSSHGGPRARDLRIMRRSPPWPAHLTPSSRPQRTALDSKDPASPVPGDRQAS